MSTRNAIINPVAELEALAASAAAALVADGEGCLPGGVEDVMPQGSKFVIPLLIPEGIESGDGRKMAPGSLSTRDLPIPLLWQPATGDGHDKSYIVGRIDSASQTPSGIGNAMGIFDVGPYGREAERLVRAGMLWGVSADLDQFTATIDQPSEADSELAEDSNPLDTISSDKMTVSSARVMAATLVAKPAFQEPKIQLIQIVDEYPDFGDTDDIAPLSLSDGIFEEDMPEADDEGYFSALAAGAAPVNPPTTWFENPGLGSPTPLTVTDDGRVYGHIATWEQDHISYQTRVRPPRSRSNYAYFRTGIVRTDDGNDIAVGQLTLAGGHAPLDVSARDAVRHYDDTASAVADVAAGEDSFGIWVAGGLRPGVTPEQVRTLRASAPSGDWRPINNSLELVAVCQVNVPGFPVARARVASGQVVSLVAAGAATMYQLRQTRVDELADRIDALERRELAAKKAELSTRLAPIHEARERRLREAAANARAALAPGLSRKAELAQRADEARAVFKLSPFHVPPAADFKESAHPRDEHGQFRQILGHLDSLIKGTDQESDPATQKAVATLTKAADLEDAGDHSAASEAAGEAAHQLEDVATQAGGHPDGVTGGEEAAPAAAPAAKLGDEIHSVAQKIASAVGNADKATGGENDIPQEFQDVLETLYDNLVGEKIDPQTAISHMDSRLKAWLTGKGFSSPEDLLGTVSSVLGKKVNPGITQ